MAHTLELEKSRSDSVEEIKYDEEEKGTTSKLRLLAPNGAHHGGTGGGHVQWKSAKSFEITPATGHMIDALHENEEHKEELSPFRMIADDEDGTNLSGIEEKEEEKHSDSDKSESTSLSNDDDIETEANLTRKPSLVGQSKNKKYPYYINKALFHVSDDENLEVLVDEAVLKLLSFNELWQDQEGFVRCLYNDGEFASAVKRVYETLAGMSHCNFLLFSLCVPKNCHILHSRVREGEVWLF